MSEPSKEAWDRARESSWPHLAGQDISWLAAAMQTLMDQRDEQRGFKQDALDRAAAAEGKLAALEQHIRILREAQDRNVREHVARAEAAAARLHLLVRRTRVAAKTLRNVALGLEVAP